VQSEALFYAYDTFWQKVGGALAMSLSTLALAVYGKYESGCCTQQFQVEETLRVIQGPVCSGCVCGSIHDCCSTHIRHNFALPSSRQCLLHSYVALTSDNPKLLHLYFFTFSLDYPAIRFAASRLHRTFG
jgi:hypothetical protein